MNEKAICIIEYEVVFFFVESSEVQQKKNHIYIPRRNCSTALWYFRISQSW